MKVKLEFEVDQASTPEEVYANFLFTIDCLADAIIKASCEATKKKAKKKAKPAKKEKK